MSPPSFNPEEPCVVCFKNAKYFSIGSCDHPVCYECSTRMRVLCQQNECPICRQLLSKVYFTSKVKSFKAIENYEEIHLKDDKYKIYFDGSDAQHAYNILLQNKCPICSQTFSIFLSLKEHVSKEHKRFYCDLCVKNLKIFSSERRCYERSELTTHRRVGDADDKSHKGHPLCEFCDVRYNDNDELYRHLRKDHYCCHFCDADGHHYYFNKYPDLRVHFQEEHFLCQEESCINEQFTSVFRSEIDLKAHMFKMHGKSMGKYAAKQARRVDAVDLGFSLSSNRGERERGGQSGSGRNHSRHNGESSRYHNRQENPPEPSRPQQPQTVEINSSAEFPGLGGNTAPILPVQQVRKKKPSEDFPALGGGNSSSGPGAGRSDQWNKVPKKINANLQSLPQSSQVQQSRPNSQQPILTNSSAFPSLPTASSTMTTSSSSQQQQGLSWSKIKQQPKPQQQQQVKQKQPQQQQKTILNIAKNVQNRSKNSKNVRSNSHDDEDERDSQRINYKNNPILSGINSSHSALQNEHVQAALQSDHVSSYVNRSKIQLVSSSSVNNNSNSQNNLNYNNIVADNESKKVKMKKKNINSNGEPNSNTRLMNSQDFPSLEQTYQPVRPVSAPAGSGPNRTGYIHPMNFQNRNSKLLENIQTNIGPAFDDFKTISMLFLSERMVPEEYYEYCLRTLGRNSFNEIFPQLLLLLPNIQRQKALWAVHNKNPSSKNKKIVARLDQCATCGQIIHLDELKFHLDAHKRAAPNTSATGTSSSGKKNNVKSAWTKR